MKESTSQMQNFLFKYQSFELSECKTVMLTSFSTIVIENYSTIIQKSH